MVFLTLDGDTNVPFEKKNNIGNNSKNVRHGQNCSRV